MIKDPQNQNQHQTLVFSSEQWWRLQPPAWLSAPISDTSCLKPGRWNETSAKAPSSLEYCGLRSGPCRWWKSPVGPRTWRWLQQGLGLVGRSHRWSRLLESPEGRSKEGDETKMLTCCNKVFWTGLLFIALPYWWWETVCRPPEHHQASDQSPPLLLSGLWPRHPDHWGLSSHPENTPHQHWSSAKQIKVMYEWS